MDYLGFRRYNIIKRCVKFAWQNILLYSREHSREWKRFREISKVIFHYSKQRDDFYNFSIARKEREETTHTR